VLGCGETLGKRVRIGDSLCGRMGEKL
jgi:hypothetical protein